MVVVAIVLVLGVIVWGAWLYDRVRRHTERGE